MQPLSVWFWREKQSGVKVAHQRLARPTVGPGEKSGFRGWEGRVCASVLSLSG